MPGLRRSALMFAPMATLLAAGATPSGAAPIGSYSFTYNGVAPPNTTVRLTSTTESNGSNLSDFPAFKNINISGDNAAQAADAALQAAGGFNNLTNAAAKGTTEVDLTAQGGFSLLKVDGGTTQAGFGVTLDGTVPAQNLVPDPTNPQKGKWIVGFEPGLDPTQGVTVAGDLGITVNGANSYSTPLAVGTTPAQAATAFYTLLQTSGFPDVQAPTATPDGLGIGVAFSLTPSATLATTIDSLSFTGANLEADLFFPQVVPEPPAWVMAGTATMAGLGCWWRRRRGAKA